MNNMKKFIDLFDVFDDSDSTANVRNTEYDMPSSIFDVNEHLLQILTSDSRNVYNDWKNDVHKLENIIGKTYRIIDTYIYENDVLSNERKKYLHEMVVKCLMIELPSCVESIVNEELFKFILHTELNALLCKIDSTILSSIMNTEYDD